jgi:dihydroorotase
MRAAPAPTTWTISTADPQSLHRGFALLNISRVGLIAQNELANMANIDADAVKQAVKRHPDFIVGLKARMSSSVVGENGITPLERAKAIQKENGDLPLMVHIGNNPPNLDEIAELLSSATSLPTAITASRTAF